MAFLFASSRRKHHRIVRVCIMAISALAGASALAMFWPAPASSNIPLDIAQPVNYAASHFDLRLPLAVPAFLGALLLIARLGRRGHPGAH